ADDSVVSEDAPVLLERMGVLDARLTRGRVPDVGEEGSRPNVLGTDDERLAAVRRGRFAVHRGRPVGVEGAEPDPVRLARALQDQAQRRVEQPERRLDVLSAAGHAEKPAHGLILWSLADRAKP